MEVIFVLDASGSVHTDFVRQTDFISSVVQPLTIQPNAHRVALIEYSGVSRQQIKIHFEDFQASKEGLITAIKSLPFFSGTTATGKALELAKTLLPSARRGVPVFVITLTDGYSQDLVNASADALRAAGVKTYAVGLTQPVNA